MRAAAAAEPRGPCWAPFPGRCGWAQVCPAWQGSWQSPAPGRAAPAAVGPVQRGGSPAPTSCAAPTSGAATGGRGPVLAAQPTARPSSAPAGPAACPSPSALRSLRAALPSPARRVAVVVCCRGSQWSWSGTGVAALGQVGARGADGPPAGEPVRTKSREPGVGGAETSL